MQYNEEYENHATMNIADKRMTHQRLKNDSSMTHKMTNMSHQTQMNQSRVHKNRKSIQIGC